MKQIVQNLKSGETLLAEIPAPAVGLGQVRIQTHRSLVSLGTERMLVEFGRAGFIAKARQQPEKVKQVLDKIRSDGLTPTLEAVFRRLDEPLPLGYCNVGTVIEIGAGVKDIRPGDRVASNGPHAEIVTVPKNLVAKIPESVSDDEACFTVIGSIGLQGIRLAAPTFGETVAVIGLGLIGLLTVQLLLANGCNVIGFDFDETKVDLARQFGATAYKVEADTDQAALVRQKTSGNGADAVLITASSKSDAIMQAAARMSRKRGRVVLVGVVGLQLNRSDFYEKELSFQVSCSYGPGRYDEDYETKGRDYPAAYVRWTEKRNFEAILDSLARKRLNVTPLITEIVDVNEFDRIYSQMDRGNAIASILAYSDKVNTQSTIALGSEVFPSKGGMVGIIGSGNFTKMTMMPILNHLGYPIKAICSAKGLSATHLAKKYSIPVVTTDVQRVWEDDNISAVIITTRHHLHASMVVDALRHGKHVFVEKPLCINAEELDDIIEHKAEADRHVMVGFNRRFSPFIQKAKTLLSGKSPINVIATMNAGSIPPESWVHDPEVGGGRIIGEACHFIDLGIFLTGSRATSIYMTAIGKAPGDATDDAVIVIKCEDGSRIVVNYLSNGSRAYSKERIEIHSHSHTLVIDNFMKMTGYGFKSFSSKKSRQDKGHSEQFRRYLDFMKRGGHPPIEFSETVASTKATFAAMESLKTRTVVPLNG